VEGTGSQYSEQEDGYLMKKILLSILIIGIVAAIAIGGTAAYFATNSNSGYAQFDMATVGLSVGVDSNQYIIHESGIYPGWSKDLVAFVTNTGTAPLVVTATWDGTNAGAIDSLLDIGAITVDPAPGITYVDATHYRIEAGYTATVHVAMSFPYLASAQAGAGATGYYLVTFQGQTP
jgi:hypothetical protein